MFQSDMNITSVLQAKELDNFLDHLSEINTDAIAYVTLYPMEGFAAVSDQALQDLVLRLNNGLSRGLRFFIRYSSEMNGNWFRYGQQPTAFLASWRRVIGYVRQATNNSQNIAFIWAPNSGNGYPFLGGKNITIPRGSPDYLLMDTNNDGEIDINDDPYTPFYPGDEWVDWVGFSVILRF